MRSTSGSAYPHSGDTTRGSTDALFPVSIVVPVYRRKSASYGQKTVQAFDRLSSNLCAMKAAHLIPFALLAACSSEPAEQQAAAKPVKLHYYTMGPT